MTNGVFLQVQNEPSTKTKKTWEKPAFTVTGDIRHIVKGPLLGNIDQLSGGSGGFQTSV